MTDPVVLHEDDAIIVLAKPAGLATHPPAPEAQEGQAPRVHDVTLVDWLTDQYPNFETNFPKLSGQIWRPGIVHRLDQDTSGMMVIAITPEALVNLQDQFRGRTTEKIYRALVAGTPDESGELSGAIARSDADPTHQEIRRLSFSWSKGHAREAETAYHCLAHSSAFPPRSFHLTSGKGKVENSHTTGRAVSLIELLPKTGRMHQLRVQLADAGWPILGDAKYGTKLSQRLSIELGIHRQLLHALRLSFDHPITSERLTFCAPYPADFLKALTQLDLPSNSC